MKKNECNVCHQQAFPTIVTANGKHFCGECADKKNIKGDEKWDSKIPALVSKDGKHFY